MAINRVEIKDFLVFKGDFAVDFCPGVNVLIGGNGTGKTTLLKVMYLVMEPGNIRKRALPSDKTKSSVLKQYFQNICTGPCHISLGTDNFDKTKRRAESYIHCVVDDLEIINDTSAVDGITLIRLGNQVFIPEKDLLSNSKGLPETVEFGKLQFTDCEIDIIKKARVAPSKPKQELVKRIEEIIGGEVENDGESFFIKKTDLETPIPFAMEASGFKKFGLLATLIRNEQITSGTVLFWDEPENSLNPELLPVLVDILLELQRGGVQVFIATHSGILASYFATNRQKDKEVMFYSLYKDGEHIKYDKSDRFDLLMPNTLTAEPVKLYEKEIEGWLGNG